MSNLTRIIDHLKTSSSEERGRAFEKYCKWFLENDSCYAIQLKQVWLWNDWPGNWGRDKGIDLIAETHNGELWAIQAKAYDKSYYITKEDVDKFLSESSRKAIAFRLLIATTNNIGSNAHEVLSAQEKPVGLCLLESLEKAEIDWALILNGQNTRRQKRVRKPFPHQEQALQDILSGFEKSSCGQLQMACGTGKTLVGLWLAERMKCNTTLILVPSISLVSQLYREWANNCSDVFNFYPIFVCSDETVGDDDTEQFMEQTTHLGFPITTNAKELVKALAPGSCSKVVFATYHSSPVIKDACKFDQTLNFDLAIADEAHRCSGKANSDFATIVDKNAICVARKLFMTATPKIFSNHVKAKTQEFDYEIISMDDQEKFGPVFYKLPFSEAIKRDLLSDYQVLIAVMDNETYRDYVERGRFVSCNDHQTDARTLASQLLVAKAIRQYDLKKVITFHNRTKSAKEFVNALPLVTNMLADNEKPNIGFTSVIFGHILQSERIRILNQFKETSEGCSLLGNVKCLSEGVDVPALDGIAFIDPKGSEIDIVQAVGRAIRKAHRDVKKIGTIIIPVFIDEKGSELEILEQSCFQTVWKVLKALRAHDDVLAEELDTIRLELGKRTYRKPPKLTKITIDIPKKIGIDFGEALQIKLIENIIAQCSSQWFFSFGELLNYRQKNPNKWPDKRSSCIEEQKLGRWCGTQRKAYKKNIILRERANLLSGMGFIWDHLDNTWSDTFHKLNTFRLKNPERWPSTLSIDPLEAFLARWCVTQRNVFKNNKLELDRYNKLTDIGFVWNTFNEGWTARFKDLYDFRLENSNRWPSQKSKMLAERKLGRWCTAQRCDFKQNYLEPAKIEALNNIGFRWNELDSFWNDNFDKVKTFRSQHNKWPSCKSKESYERFLGAWCGKQRRYFKQEKLSPGRISKLNSIEFNWKPFQDTWDEQFNYLQQYRVINPTLWPTREVQFPQGNKLGAWCHHQRENLRDELLSSERKKKMDEIGFSWKLSYGKPKKSKHQ